MNIGIYLYKTLQKTIECSEILNIINHSQYQKLLAQKQSYSVENDYEINWSLE